MSSEPASLPEHLAPRSPPPNLLVPGSTSSSIRPQSSSGGSIHSLDPSAANVNKLTPIQSHGAQDVSAIHPSFAPVRSNTTIPDTIYDRLTPARKVIIVAVVSYCSFLAPISSTTILAAVPEVADQYGTTGTIINLSNALYMLFMGFSPCFWGPMSQVYGRRWVSIITAVLFLACSLGTALSPNLPAYFIFRILTAFEGTSFLNVGASVIGDIYRPSERGTAMGWFLSGALMGPAFGPFIGGIIVTFCSWRVIFYLQTALAGLACILVYFLLPETIHHKKSDDLVGLPLSRKFRVLWGMTNPWRVVKLFRYPNMICIAFASGSLVWNQYSLLTPIRYVLNPRFHLSTPIQSGLFYLAPGGGYIMGTFVGGRYADYINNKWTAKRDGERIPEDRLRAAIPFMGIVIPACMLLYGWSVEKEFGGIPLPVIMMFLQGVAQLFCFPALNTYCMDVMQSRGAEVIAGNYLSRYLFAALGSAVVLPAVESIGVGWFSTVSAGFLAAASFATWCAVRWGKGWREGIDGKRREKRRLRLENGDEEKRATVKDVLQEEAREMGVLEERRDEGGL